MTRSRWIFLGSAALVILLVAGLASLSLDSLAPLIAARFPNVEWVDAATLQAWIDDESETETILLDARAPEELAVSHLDGAVRIDLDAADFGSLEIPPEARVVVYCSVGYRSAVVAEALADSGAKRVYNLRGGIFGWASEGRPIVRDGAPADSVHPFDAFWGRFLRPELRWQPAE